MPRGGGMAQKGVVKVAVLFGGTSSERDVSLASAVQVMRALRSRGHGVLPVDVEQGVLDDLRAAELFARGVAPTPPVIEKQRRFNTAALASSGELASVDVAFLALHGGKGEDGTIQGLLDLLRIPFTGSDLRGSSLAWDKDLAKRLFRAAGVPTADWLMAPIDTEEAVAQLGLPIVVKPSREGSTVGLTVVQHARQLQAAIELARSYDDEVMLERYISGKEVTVGVLDGEALAVGEIVPTRGSLFDYESKYQSGGASATFPADLSPELTTRLKAYAAAAHRALKLRAYSRTDFRIDENSQPYVLETNSLPGMSAKSLFPQSARAEGIPFELLCEKICQLALMPAHDAG